MYALPLAAILVSLATANPSQESEVEEVTPADVKRFIDPTRLINSLDYNFTASFLPGDLKLYSHTLSPVWALSDWTAVWADIPYSHFSFPEEQAPSGVGDVVMGWGAIIHEDLTRRYTSTVGFVEVRAPTGSAEKGTGFDRWVLSPGVAFALNPTDLFPIFVRGQYSHSTGGEAGRPVRLVQLSVNTAHILPKGFYVSAVPVFVFDLDQDTNLFSLGLGGGRAITRNFAWSAAYLHHVAGSQTFSQAFTVGLSFIWGEERVAGQ